MKNNGNYIAVKDYYIGLDIGTSSVGYAVTDTLYNLKKHNGKAMWGVRLFDEGETAEERRKNRTARRRLARRNQRIDLLNMLFNEKIAEKDAGFFMRLKESSLTLDDKEGDAKYSLFNDDGFTDKDYMRDYKTVYHLRKELASSEEEHDIRLVYLAVRHIIKNRGHFLFEVDGNESRSFADVFDTLTANVMEILDIELFTDSNKVYEILISDKKKSEKVKEILALCSGYEDKAEKKAVEKLLYLLTGGKAKLSDIFGNDADNKSISVDMDDEALVKACEEIDGAMDLISSVKAVYDVLILDKITRGYPTVSDYKIAQYEQHHKDIAMLKNYVNLVMKDRELYKEIFKDKKDTLKNYSAYSGYRKGDSYCKCTQEESCKYLKSKLPKTCLDSAYTEMYSRIDEGIFATKLKGTENGVIPNGLHRKELIDILSKASGYLPFLNERDSDGISVKDKIISIFDHKTPYFVGKLKGGWAVLNSKETVYPWNFGRVVNLEKSAENFIKNMTALCSYTGEDVLPKDSLLYKEYEVLNEINNLKINGHPITVEWKKLIFEELFVNNNKKVTLKSIDSFLRRMGAIKTEDVISGVDEVVKSNLSSYHKLKNIIRKTSVQTAEEIIRRIVLFGQDKKMLEKWLKDETDLCKEDIEYLKKQKFEGWGRLSSYLLKDIYCVNKETGEAMNMIEMMRNTNLNHMKLLSKDFSFKEQADAHRAEKYNISLNPKNTIDELYVSPKIRRAIWQTMRMVDEIADIMGGSPKKIFIEVARDRDKDNEKKRTSSRKERLVQLYKDCGMESDILFEELCKVEEARLRKNSLFLYYMQFGRCMYSGDPIDLSKLNDNAYYDIDHIYPRSKIKDNSIDNMVLVRAELNRDKTNKYPIEENIREGMSAFWYDLYKKNMISKEKYQRLKRHTPLTEDELTAFINRQIVETRQSTKAAAQVFDTFFGNSKIVYSKAGNISDFRDYFKLYKLREVNDHHHAKDAYLNIVVGNYFDTRFTSDFFRNIHSTEYSIKPEAMYTHSVKGAWKADETICTVRGVMNKNNVLVSRMSEEKKGKLFDVTIEKRKPDLINIKKNLPTEKYGGYNSAKGAYFVLIEHSSKKNRVRTVEPVYIYQKETYENDPISFAKSVWGLKEPVIIVSKIPFNSLLELDGIKGNVTGRTGNYLLLNHAHQLILDNETIHSLKFVKKYVDRYKENGQMPSVKNEDEIRSENIRIYDILLEKLETKIYAYLFPKMKELMMNNRQKFTGLSILEQGKTLLESLKAFKCDGGAPSFKDFCGEQFVVNRRKSKVITSYKTAYLIHQSPTGLFETKIDLLK